MRLDALTVEILRNYLQGAVEEMAYVVERTAYTTFVKETADFTCGLLNPLGGVLRLSGRARRGQLRRHQLRAHPRGGRARSSRATSSSPTIPYGSAAAATHLPDIHLIRPIFWDGRLVAYGAGFLHSSDVGGMVPASISPRASEIFQEGLRHTAQEALRARRGQPRPARRDPGQLPDPRAELGRSPGAGGRAHHRRAPDARADPPLRARHRRQGHGRPDRLRRPQGRGAHPPHAGRPLRVLGLHRGRRGDGHPHPAEGRADHRRRRDPPGLHGQRRAGGLGPQRAHGRPRPPVHVDRARELLRHPRPHHSR